MKRVSIIVLAASSIALAMLLAFRTQPVPEPHIQTPVSLEATRFVDRPRFMRALAGAPSECPMKQPRAAVVNHHALMSDLMARIIMPLHDCLGQNPRIIILSPDHFRKSSSPVAFHRLNYQFDGAEIAIDLEAADRLEKNLSFAKEQPAIFENEHGIGALIPFIASSIPDAEILPLVLKRASSDEELFRLSEFLKQEMASGTFILVSSDMSHYLGEMQAKLNDQKTLAGFSSGDASFFAQASDDYTDNGRALAAVIHALGSTSFNIVDSNKISSERDGAQTFTTTYITGFWE